MLCLSQFRRSLNFIHLSCSRIYLSSLFSSLQLSPLLLNRASYGVFKRTDQRRRGLRACRVVGSREYYTWRWRGRVIQRRGVRVQAQGERKRRRRKKELLVCAAATAAVSLVESSWLSLGLPERPRALSRARKIERKNISRKREATRGREAWKLWKSARKEARATGKKEEKKKRECLKSTATPET